MHLSQVVYKCKPLQLKDANPDHILGRKTAGSNNDPSIDLLTTANSIKFDGKIWSHNLNLAIFDGFFVSENVHSGEVVDTDQKRNLYRVIVGAPGVELANQEVVLATESRAKTDKIKNMIRSIILHMLANINFEDFLALPKTDNIDDLISIQESKLVNIHEANSIKSHESLNELSLPSFPTKFRKLLAKTIGEINQDVEEKIRAHFIAHGMTLSNGGEWITQGIDNTTTNSCPFCGQGIEGLPLISAYRSVFSDNYKDLRNEIFAMRKEIYQTFGDIALADFKTLAERHKANIEFWRKHCQHNMDDLIYPISIFDAIKDLNTAALALIERKGVEMLEAIPVDDSFLNAVAVYESEKNKVDLLNHDIRHTNELIFAKKEEVSATDTKAETDELSRLKEIKNRHSPNVAELCEDYIRTLSEKDAIEKKKTKIRKQLDQHTNGIIKPYQKRINEFLEAFNAEFEIAETKHNYAGGIAISSYQLIINKTLIDIGGSNTPIDKPSFKNTLSAGDKSTLALAFFLTHLEQDSNLAEKIIVFDDPFNSQDAFRRRQTIHEILKIAKKCTQVIVLSHDATFLKQVWDKCPPAERAALNLVNQRKKGSKIMELDLEKVCQGRIATDIDDLQHYLTNGVGQPIDIIRKMRVVLETYMKTTYPNKFQERDWLGDIIGKINSDPNHPALSLHDELNEINAYTSPYHHGKHIADSIPDTIDSNELHGYTRRTLRIVNALQA